MQLCREVGDCRNSYVMKIEVWENKLTEEEKRRLPSTPTHITWESDLWHL
jgi:hypothetical protein